MEEDLLYGYVDRRKIYGVYMIEDLENWVLIIAGPEGIEINATFDLSQIIIIKGSIVLERDIWGVCKALNECRIESFPSQKCISKILEKYWP